ncbi:uncharacterized protein LOC134532031 isoform X1 [Bacillus rossius redtenbacheri]|uniref:uncharacterized protein LOC134532031 isoform X1 n=1 Tax=Bacillus rossius redtenbacheri TaxID=93214 RepID=UPI002FDCF2B9
MDSRFLLAATLAVAVFVSATAAASVSSDEHSSGAGQEARKDIDQAITEALEKCDRRAGKGMRVCDAGAGQEARKDIDQAITEALEKLRSEMQTGDASLGLPPLDPFVDSYLPFDINEEIAKAKGFLRNLTINNLSKFQIVQIKNDLKNLKAFFKFSFPLLHFTGRYNVSGRVLDSVNVFGDGNFWLNLTTLTTWGNVAISSKDGTENSAIVIKTLTVDFTLGDMKANFENLNGGGVQGAAINSVINENGVQLVTEQKSAVTSLISKYVVEFFNKLASKYTLKQVLQYLGVEN